MIRPVVLASAVLYLSACGGSGSSTAAKAPTPPITRTSAGASTSRTRHARQRPRHHRHHRHRRGPDPGRLPQTMQLPSAATPDFRARVRDLWRAIVTDAPHRALPAFFPLAAYQQVKAIGDPVGDWTGRLVADLDLDIHAAHQQTGSRARLLRVEVPRGYAHWVPPGACYNRVGYWEVPNSRVLYSVGGQERSFGIASMISWRGQWYVVHLGAVVRSAAAGVVDDPAGGPGTAAPSSTC